MTSPSTADGAGKEKWSIWKSVDRLFKPFTDKDKNAPSFLKPLVWDFPAATINWFRTGVGAGVNTLLGGVLGFANAAKNLPARALEITDEYIFVPAEHFRRNMYDVIVKKPLLGKGGGKDAHPHP